MKVLLSRKELTKLGQLALVKLVPRLVSKGCGMEVDLVPVSAMRDVAAEVEEDVRVGTSVVGSAEEEDSSSPDWRRPSSGICCSEGGRGALRSYTISPLRANERSRCRSV